MFVFLVQGARERLQALQERSSLLGCQCRECALERPIAMSEPASNLLGGPGVECDDGAPAVAGILAAVDQPVPFELGGQLARRRERETERRGDLAHRLFALSADVRQHRQVAPAERGVARDELQEPGRWPPAPEPPEHLPQRRSELAQLAAAHGGNGDPP